ncbi:hypothetical protein HPB49_017765 [Dermacentor silvarum]|uniref:Uncharacterized protein n=1 Tax=Dermacentor silvarum TaxID=543639 RepID=A0ACB8CGF6_DERSI|nr:hypothetical protein HPB49_017765 [Dermacentor silvarum]
MKFNIQHDEGLHPKKILQPERIKEELIAPHRGKIPLTAGLRSTLDGEYIDSFCRGTQYHMKARPAEQCLVVIKAAEEDFEAICTEGNDLEKLYNVSAPCGNSVGTKLNFCVRDMYHNLQKALEKADRSQAVHHACCYFGGLLDCVDSSLDSCENSDEPKQFILGRLEHIFGEALGLVCGRHTRGSASCAALPVLPELEPGTPEPANNLVEYGILIMQLFSRRDSADQ